MPAASFFPGRIKVVNWGQESSKNHYTEDRERTYCGLDVPDKGEATLQWNQPEENICKTCQKSRAKREREEVVLIAHRAADGREHNLAVHLEGVAQRARSFAEPFGAGEVAEWCGWWHDAGKAGPRVQRYLRGEGPGESHSGAGMLHAQEEAEERNAPFAATLATSAHHTGLYDVKEGLWRRIQEEGGDTSIRNALAQGRDLMKRISAPGQERGHRPIPAEWPPLPEEMDTRKKALRLELWARFVFSALVDADYLDTEAFFSPDLAEKREKAKEEAGGPAELLDLLLEDQLMAGQSLAGQKDSSAKEDSPGDSEGWAPLDLSWEVLAHALLAGRNEEKRASGHFHTITVPDGAGRAHAEAAFAVALAAQKNLSGVIVAVPNHSALEERAALYHRIFGDDNVLIDPASFFSSKKSGQGEEHPEGTRPESANPESANPESTIAEALAAENWSSPLTLTTTDELLGTLFGRSPGRLRKLHRYAGSVVVISEAQAIPASFARPAMDALEELTSEVYESAVVLSSATDPGGGVARGYPTTSVLDTYEKSGEPESSFQGRLRREGARVRYEALVERKRSGSEIAEMIAKEMFAREDRSALCVCNTAENAQEVARLLRKTTSGGKKRVVYLSERLCPEHRSEIASDAKERLVRGEPVLVVGTEVAVSTGLHFDVVYREVGPLAEVLAASGRCKETGEKERGKTVLFTLDLSTLEEPALLRPPRKTERDLALWMLKKEGTGWLSDPEGAARYYERLYSQYPTDLKGIQDLQVQFAYKKVARACAFGGESRKYAVVDYAGGKRLAEEAIEEAGRRGYLPREWKRRLVPYMAEIKEGASGKAGTDGEGQVRLWEGDYDSFWGTILGEID